MDAIGVPHGGCNWSGCEVCFPKRKETRYVEIAIEVECDGEGMTDQGWLDYNRLDGLFEVMPDVIKIIGQPYKTSRSAK